MQSRYYNPKIGRFINADALTSTGQGILGNNMFAYCNGNPTNFQDSAGTKMVYMNAAAPAPAGFPSSPASQSPQSGGSSGSVARRIKKLMMNTDEQAVLDAESFTFYNGVPIVKIPNSRDAFSCGIIFIGDDVSDPNTVKHEYGHYVHLLLVGVDNYLSRVVLPSIVGYASNVPYDMYYSQPWEYIADVLGCANRNNYSYSKNANTSGALYMLFTLIG